MAISIVSSRLICGRKWGTGGTAPRRNAQAPHRLIPILLLSLLLTACATLTDPESAQESSQDVIGTVRGTEGDGVIQQTFRSRRAGLNGLTLWLAPEDEQVQTSLAVELYLIPEERIAAQGEFPVFSSHIGVASRGPVHLSLPPRRDPPGQRYLIALKTTPQTPVLALGRMSDSYPGGQAYQGSHPLDADLAFRTTYQYDLGSIFEDLRRIAGMAWLALPFGLAFFAPGWLLLDLSGLRRRYDAGEQAALSLGLSLAAVPIVMLWTSLIDLRWSREGLMFTMGAVCAAIVWRVVQPALAVKVRLGGLTPARPSGSQGERSTGSFREEGSQAEESSSHPTRGASTWGTTGLLLALLSVFLLSLAVRLAMVRDLAAPPWVDSVHHSLITRLILDAGGFPDTYAPYFDLIPTQYHAGFHSSLAAFVWLSGLEIPEAMLFAGQVLNALAVLAVYCLATTLLGNRLAGVIAALVTGLITPMPAYYTSWGRYTQLAGLLILPTVLALVKQALQAPPSEAPTLAKPNRRLGAGLLSSLGLAGLATAGLVLVHYRVVAFLAVLLLAFGLVNGLADVLRNTLTLRQIAWRALLAAIFIGPAALLLAFPWVWPNLTQLLPTLAGGGGAPPKLFSGFSWQHLNAALGRYATALAGAGLVWGLVRCRRFVPILVLWIAGMFFLANLGALRLPGGDFMNNTSAAITLFMPVSLSAGYLLGQGIEALDFVAGKRWQLLYRVCITVAGFAAALTGARQILPILHPTTFLFREADRPAMQWIRDNVPAGETVLINPFLWGYGIYAGNDGGFWISPLARRNTLPPPVIYGFGSSKQNLEIGEFCKQVIAQGKHPEELWSLLQSRRIRYLYIGARGGPLSAYELSRSPRFKLLYHQNGTWVFEAVTSSTAFKRTDE